jgi:hypothetical protein
MRSDLTLLALLACQLACAPTSKTVPSLRESAPESIVPEDGSTTRVFAELIDIEDGKAIAQAELYVWLSGYRSMRGSVATWMNQFTPVPLDADGRFDIVPDDPQRAILQINAPGYALTYVSLAKSRGEMLRPWRVELRRTSGLDVRLKPPPGADRRASAYVTVDEILLTQPLGSISVTQLPGACWDGRMDADGVARVSEPSCVPLAVEVRASDGTVLASRAVAPLPPGTTHSISIER